MVASNKNSISVSSDVYNWTSNQATSSSSGEYFQKISPHDGTVLWNVPRSNATDVLEAVEIAKNAQANWAEMPGVQRGKILFQVCALMEKEKEKIAIIVSTETGKSMKDALSETDAAIALGNFYAGEGQRLYGKTTTSGIKNRFNSTIRQPCGVAGLIVAANTPIANVAWKVFPALICGNAVVLKASEDAPMTAFIFADIMQRAGLPSGILNVIHGLGKEAGLALVEQANVNIISFTGSTNVGRLIGEIAGKRLIKVSLELGGKNPFVICDDANIDQAVHWALLSAFSNAGQRCAAASRIIIFDSIYDIFVEKLINETKKLQLGNKDCDHLGPVINSHSLTRMLATIDQACQEGGRILCGGKRFMDPPYHKGFYMTPTLIDNVSPTSELSQHEIFGPIAALFRVKDLDDAVTVANNSLYGLTASIHTQNISTAMQFMQSVQAGVVSINGGTFGSEPHMPFGGVKQSGNGSREPGTEALDIYSELKNIYLNM